MLKPRDEIGRFQYNAAMLLRGCTWLWRGVIALVFLTAAWSKWNTGIVYFDPVTMYDRFVAGSPIRHYAILAAEVFAGIWVLSTVKPRWSAIYSAALLTGFTVLLVIEVIRDNPVVCGCGLREVRPDGDPRVELAFSIGRNVILLLGCGWLWLFPEEPAPTPITSPQPSPSGEESPPVH